MDEANQKTTLESRELRWELDRLESCRAALFLARSLYISANLETEAIDSLIQPLEGRCDSLRTSLTQTRLESRHRARLPKLDARPKYTLFIDECGGHSKPVDNEFPVFCLCCVIVKNETYEELFVPRWEGLKAKFLQWTDSTTRKVMGRSSITHEPSLRPGKLRYRLRRIKNGPMLFEQELSSFITEVPFTIIASVVLKSDYFRIYGDSPVDVFLPSSIYSVCLDFIVERAVHFLSADNKGALGRVVAESRERREDAVLQYEFVRLQLEGTQYVSPSWFRQQLSPTIEFRTKADNIAGLQLADLVVRPIAEKVLKPENAVSRWELVKKKFYDGGQGRPESYGLKAFPNPVNSDIFL